MSSQCLPPSFRSIWLTVPEQILIQDFQAGHHGGHLGYWNETNLAILKLHVISMPLTKFRLNLTCCSGADMVWRFSRWPTWGPSLISERNEFSNSESLCCSPQHDSDNSEYLCLSNASHQVLAQSNLRFGRCRSKNFKIRPSWISERNNLSYSEFLCRSDASHQVLSQSDLWFWRCRLKNDKMDGGHLGYRNGTVLAILNLYNAPMPPIKSRLNLTYGLGGDVNWGISSWKSERNDFSNFESMCHCDVYH